MMNFFLVFIVVKLENMEQIISKQELDEFKQLKGEVRGMPFRSEAEFILKEEGEEGLKKLEDVMERLGYPIKYRKIKRLDFYPLGLLAVNLLAIKRLFGYDDKKFQEMGKFEGKSSFIIKLFLKYFVSLDRAIKEVPRMWEKHYTVGSLKIVKW